MPYTVPYCPKVGTVPSLITIESHRYLTDLLTLKYCPANHLGGKFHASAMTGKLKKTLSPDCPQTAMEIMHIRMETSSSKKGQCRNPYISVGKGHGTLLHGKSKPVTNHHI